MSDEEAKLAHRVHERIRQHPYMGTVPVDVVVDGSTARLSGRVESDLQRQSAEQAAAQVAGVDKVINELRIRAPGEATDRQLEGSLKGEIAKNPVLKSAQIAVSARAGVVTLRGTVPTWQAFDALMEAVYRAGPSGVTNEVSVSENREEVQYVVPREPRSTTTDGAAARSALAEKPKSEPRAADAAKPSPGSNTTSATEVDKAGAEPGESQTPAP